MKCLIKYFGCSLHSDKTNCILRSRRRTWIFSNRKNSNIPFYRYNGNQFACIPFETVPSVQETKIYLDKRKSIQTYQNKVNRFAEKERKKLKISADDVKDKEKKERIRQLNLLRKRKERL